MLKNLKLIYNSCFYAILHFYISNTKEIDLEQKGSKLITSLKKLLEKTPYWKEGHFKYAKLAYDQKLIAEAYASVCAVEIIGGFNDEISLKILKAKCFFSTGEVKRGVEILNLALKDYPENSLIYSELASGYLLLGDKEKARNYLEKVDPNLDLPEISILRDYVS